MHLKETKKLHLTDLFETILRMSHIMLKWRWHPHLLQESGFGIPISLDSTILCHTMLSLTVGRWHSHFCQEGALGIPTSLSYTRRCYTILYCPWWRETWFPPLSRRWGWHPHLTILFYIISDGSISYHGISYSVLWLGLSSSQAL